MSLSHELPIFLKYGQHYTYVDGHGWVPSVYGGEGEPPADPGTATPPIVTDLPPATTTSPAADATVDSTRDLPPLDYRSSLPPELQRNPTIRKYNSVTELAKGMVEASGLVGRSIQLPPGDDPAAWGNVWNKLGRPESANDYTNPEALELPEGLELDPGSITMLREGAHAAGFTQKQYEAALGMHAQWLRGMVNQAQAAQAEAYHSGEQELAKQFGASAPRLKQAAQAVFEMLGNGVWGGEAGTAAYKAIIEAGLDNNVAVVTAFANLFEKMREGEYLVNDAYPAGVQSSADIDKQIAALREKEQKDGHLTPDENRQMDSLYQAKQRLREGRGRQTAGV